MSLYCSHKFVAHAKLTCLDADLQLAILSYPSLEPAFQTLRFPNINKGDLYDADFDDSGDYVRRDGSVTSNSR